MLLVEPGVSIITCTNHPQLLKNIIDNYRRQTYKRKELIIIINKDSINLIEWRQKVAKYPNIKIYKVAERITLGQCLNCGISKAKYPLIAKMDSDDYYSPYYLEEQVNVLLLTKSEVVGKNACFVYLTDGKKLLVRSYSEMNKYVELIQGGTIIFRRSILKKVRFSDISLGEDVKFLQDCARHGFSIYASSPYNYVYIRRKNKNSHTWQVEDQRFINEGQPIAVTNNFAQYAAKKFKHYTITTIGKNNKYSNTGYNYWYNN